MLGNIQQDLFLHEIVTKLKVSDVRSIACTCKKYHSLMNLHGFEKLWLTVHRKFVSECALTKSANASVCLNYVSAQELLTLQSTPKRKFLSAWKEEELRQQVM